MPFTFEEKHQEVIDTIRRYQAKWRLNILHWMDYEDVASEITFHVWKKWHLWDQTRPLAPWVAQVCHNQIRNKLRNLYTNFARPCIKCEHNLEGNHCAITKNHDQCSECPLYARWEENKKNAYGIKMPLELVNHQDEVNSLPSTEIDYDLALEKLVPLLKEELGDKMFTAFYMLYFEHKSEKEVADFLQMRASAQNSVAKQMVELREWLFTRVRRILADSDIPELWQ